MKKVGIFLYYTGKSLMYLDPEVIDCNIFYLVQVCSTFGRFLIKNTHTFKRGAIKTDEREVIQCNFICTLSFFYSEEFLGTKAGFKR